MFCSFGTREVSVLGKGKGASIILEDDISRDRIALSLEKISRPKDVARFVVETNEFTLGRAFGRNFLFDRGACCSAFAESKKTPSMSLAVIMRLMRSLDIPNDR